SVVLSGRRSKRKPRARLSPHLRVLIGPLQNLDNGFDHSELPWAIPPQGKHTRPYPLLSFHHDCVTTSDCNCSAQNFGRRYYYTGTSYFYLRLRSFGREIAASAP